MAKSVVLLSNEWHRCICLGYMNLRGILDGKQTLCYKFISDILISRFSGINKCSQGHNIFAIEFDSSRYQIFVISLICISAEIPAYTNKSVRDLTYSSRPPISPPASSSMSQQASPGNITRSRSVSTSMRMKLSQMPLPPLMCHQQQGCC